MKNRRIIVIALLSISWIEGYSQAHPSLMITPSAITDIRANLDSAPLFVSTLESAIADVDAEIELGVKVPIPKDMSGGYTHERHKQNFFILQKAGYIFQITGEVKYAQYIKDLFMAYADMFPTLPKHPTDRSYATGKIFWQCLNDANWLVYCSQAYDCIYDWLDEDTRSHLESKLFRPLADFLSIENPQFYNRVHNHSTWGNAAVGMIGLVMDDEELIQRALYGIQNDGLSNDLVDNDGGYIKKDGVRRAGFYAQLDYSFSPDGHFTEGPYYLRYAMTPFLLFAKSLANCRPDLNIFSYRDSILDKAIYSLLYETDAKGRFFPINDAQKGMSWMSREVVSAVNIGYHDLGRDPMLLSIAQLQGRVQLDETGYLVAHDIAQGKAVPFKHKSISYTDGEDGNSGGITILRADDPAGDEICLLMKYAAQGMGHGHFDRLGYSLYDEEGEIVQDYGSARWVNIDQKGGGRYLPENHSFAKQTIAHNALVVNETSQYGGDVKTGEKNSPDLFFEDLANTAIQIVSAKDSHAYDGVVMHRTMCLVTDSTFRKPFVIDILKATADEAKSFDLPLWFMGHILSTNFEYQTELTNLIPLGKDHGYQHIWEEAKGQPDSKSTQLTWFANGKFYTMSSATQPEDQLILGRAGANDPNFNLRHDPVFIHRKSNRKEATFASVIESHGRYNPVSEIPLDPFAGVENVSIEYDSDDYTFIEITKRSGSQWLLGLANRLNDSTHRHALSVKGIEHQWQGPYLLVKQ